MPTACPWEAHARRYRQRDWGKRSPVANRTGQAQNRGREGGGRGGSADDRHRRWTGTDESRLALRFYSLAGLGRSNGVGPVRQTAPWYATGGDVGNVGSNGRGEPRQKSTPSNGYPWPRTCCIRGSEETK